MPLFRAVRRRAGSRLVVVLALVCTPLAAQTIGWAGSVGVASDWLLRGVRLSDGKAPLVFGGLDAYAGPFDLGVNVMRLRSRQGDWSNVLTLRGGAQWRITPQLALAAEVQHIRYGGSLADWNGNNVALGAHLGDWGALFLNRQRLREPVLDADSLDAALRWPLTPQWRLTGGLGHAWRGLGSPYLYGQGGVEWHPATSRLHLQRVWTHGVGHELAGPATASRWVAGASWDF